MIYFEFAANGSPGENEKCPGKMKEITTDFDLYEDSDEEDLHKPEDVSHYWNENTHRAFTSGPNGGIDVE